MNWLRQTISKSIALQGFLVCYVIGICLIYCFATEDQRHQVATMLDNTIKIAWQADMVGHDWPEVYLMRFFLIVLCGGIYLSAALMIAGIVYGVCNHSKVYRHVLVWTTAYAAGGLIIALSFFPESSQSSKSRPLHDHSHSPETMPRKRNQEYYEPFRNYEQGTYNASEIIGSLSDTTIDAKMDTKASTPLPVAIPMVVYKPVAMPVVSHFSHYWSTHDVPQATRAATQDTEEKLRTKRLEEEAMQLGKAKMREYDEVKKREKEILRQLQESGLYLLDR